MLSFFNLLLLIIMLLPVNSFAAQEGVALEKRILQSQVMMNDGDFEKAKGVLEEALDFMPNEPKLYFYLGNVNRELGWLEEAIAAYKAAINIHPGYLQALEVLADTYRISENWQKALETYDQIINIDSTSASPFFEKAKIYRHQGQFEEEREALTETYLRNPEFLQQSASLQNYEIDEFLSQHTTRKREGLKQIKQNNETQINVVAMSIATPKEANAKNTPKQEDKIAASENKNFSRSMFFLGIAACIPLMWAGKKLWKTRGSA